MIRNNRRRHMPCPQRLQADSSIVCCTCGEYQGGLEVRSDGHRPTVSLHLHIRLYRRHMRYLPASPFPLRPRETDRRDAVQGGSGTRHARNPLRVKAPSLLLSSLLSSSLRRLLPFPLPPSFSSDCLVSLHRFRLIIV
ncbi:hypothetical protein CEXT_266981 [Caerostris extrusa]|uniref:Uncharacterized protein n=1 Tax=Caerostris extrusa TaxID=172846 RepID=A0AAV4SDK1_CAEEX|nr:hypothetical protein CEXT_266981 [Caerostris extrusa]